MAYHKKHISEEELTDVIEKVKKDRSDKEEAEQERVVQGILDSLETPDD